MPSAVPSARVTSAEAEEHIAVAVRAITRAWIRYGKEEARQLDLSFPELFLLAVLHDAGTIPVTRWAESMGTPPSTTTGLLDNLEGGGYIVRTHDPADRRQVLVSLSPKGRRLADRMKAKSRARWSRLCEGIPAREIEAIATTFDRIVARMEPDLEPLVVEVRHPPRSARARREA